MESSNGETELLVEVASHGEDTGFEVPCLIVTAKEDLDSFPIVTHNFTRREMHSMLESDGTNGKLTLKPIIHFHTWRVGIIFFLLGNCLNFISFGYAAQSLLAALGSIQFVSYIAFAYFVLNKMVTVKILVATAFIVLGNIFLVAYGNHQSPGEENLCFLFLGNSLDRIGMCCFLSLML